MSEKVKEWLTLGAAIVALAVAVYAALKDGTVTAEEADAIKAKAGAVVDAFVSDGVAEAAPVNVEQKGGE